MSTIDVKQLTKKFHGQTVLHGIDLQVNAGEVVAIIGPSGSGKTTLLRSINLLEEPDGGTIKVGNIEIDGNKPISKQKTKSANCVSRWASCSRTSTCSRTVLCSKTLLKAR